jgi:protein-glutamine gamma-glutamyltransferase
MMLAQAYGSSEKIPLSVFSWFLRRSPERALARKSINISFLYFGLCLIAASATGQATPQFYPALALLIAMALMSGRPRRIPQPLWIVMIALVALAGHVGHQQLRILHSNVEGALARWFISLFSRQYNLNESRTAIGRIGRIQLSGRIVYRVRPEAGQSAPALLRDASYDTYRSGTWRGTENEFAQVFVDTNEIAVLQPPKKLNFAVHIAGYLRRGRGQLALPQGAYELHDFPAVLETNRFGVAKVQEGPGLLNLLAYYGPGKTIDAEPTDADLDIPAVEEEAFWATARELQLDGKSEREKLRIIREFFANNFSYSLEITRKHIDRSGQRTPLGQFLTTTRSGHCEYFGSATVLLLRAAGIPARYATGYVVDDSTKKDKTFLVRERDAHAWTLVYRKDKGVWEDLDTTPGSDRAEAFKAPAWEPISDFFAQIKYLFSKWRWGKTTSTTYLKWMLVPLVVFLVWRIVSNKRRRAASGRGGIDETVWPGLDSELYWLSEKLSPAGLGRQPGELLEEWQKRLDHAIPDSESLSHIFQLHRRLRFDPLGVTPEDRRVLKVEVQQFVQSHAAKPSNDLISAEK